MLLLVLWESRGIMMANASYRIFESDKQIITKEQIMYLAEEQAKEISDLHKELCILRKDKANCERQYAEVINSKSWRFTKIFRYLTRAAKEIIKSNDDINSIEKQQLSGCDKELYLLQEGSYLSQYQDEEIFTEIPDVKVLAFYLPQFYCFPENDKWWGKGFTEWTNTRKAKPLYKNHYQPREPHEDIGYYNLTNIDTMKKQAQLANNHGIYGFCIYYYWFSGKRLMEKPLDLLIEHPEININFCLCWPNQNWTRRWDGQEKDILIAQKYDIADPFMFISDLKKYVADKRYIRVNGKPVIVVYNPTEIPSIKTVFRCWKKQAKDIGIGEITIWICRTFGASIKKLGLEGLADKEIEFPPNGGEGDMIVENDLSTRGMVFNYSKYVDSVIEKRNNDVMEKNIYRTVMLAWDNSARRKDGYIIFNHFDLKRYYDWLSYNVRETKTMYTSSERFTFINAWNEWGEGTYLEPDMQYGYANINVTSKAIFGKPY